MTEPKLFTYQDFLNYRESVDNKLNAICESLSEHVIEDDDIETVWTLLNSQRDENDEYEYDTELRCHYKFLKQAKDVLGDDWYEDILINGDYGNYYQNILKSIKASDEMINLNNRIDEITDEIDILDAKLNKKKYRNMTDELEKKSSELDKELTKLDDEFNTLIETEIEKLNSLFKENDDDESEIEDNDESEDEEDE
jgi:hypothetical protein